MSDSTEKQPLVKIELGKNAGGDLVFYTANEVAEWAQKELAFWNWLERWNDRNSPVHPLHYSKHGKMLALTDVVWMPYLRVLQQTSESMNQLS